MTCPKCGKEINDSSRFCPSCGAAAGQDPVKKKGSALPFVIGGVVILAVLLLIFLLIFVIICIAIFGNSNRKNDRQLPNTSSVETVSVENEIDNTETDTFPEEPVSDETEETEHLSAEQMEEGFKQLNEDMSVYLRVIIEDMQYSELTDIGDSVEIDFSDSEKIRAAALASDTDGVIDDIFVINGDRMVADSNAEAGPVGEGFYGQSVSKEEVEDKCSSMFGYCPDMGSLQSVCKNYSYDAVKYEDGQGLYIIVLDSGYDYETDFENHEYSISESGDGYTGEVEFFCGYWGELQNYPEFSNFKATYRLSYDAASEYGMVISSLTVSKISDLSTYTNSYEEDTEDTQSSGLTEEQAYKGIYNYCDENYGWNMADEYSMYLEAGEHSETEYMFTFRSYTGSFTYFYVDKATGNTRMVDYVPALDITEDSGTMNVYDYL